MKLRTERRNSETADRPPVVTSVAGESPVTSDFPATEVGCARIMLYRRQDRTGLSGTGMVADGVVWDDGKTVLQWRDHGLGRQLEIFDDIAQLEAIHGHNGQSLVVWCDHIPPRLATPAELAKREWDAWTENREVTATHPIPERRVTPHTTKTSAVRLSASSAARPFDLLCLDQLIRAPPEYTLRDSEKPRGRVSQSINGRGSVSVPAPRVGRCRRPGPRPRRVTEVRCRM